MRVLIYSQDGTGLGHLRRTRNIAQELLAREADCHVLTLTDSPVAPFFRPLPGIGYRELPTIVKTGPNDWRTWRESLSVREAIAIRSKLIIEAFCEFKPDVLLVDHMPVGALGELKPLLDRATSRCHRPLLFLSLRDVLDAPDVIRQAWSDLDAYAYLERYDTVLIHGSREIYDAVSAYDLSGAPRVVFNHYVAARQTRAHSAPPAGEPLILVMGGGGADAFPLAAAFLEAFPLVLAEMPAQALVVTGPNMPRPKRQALAALGASLPVRVRTSVRDTGPWLQRAAVVVTMAGYNSLAEVLRWERKALVVPRAGPSAEQRMRSRLFAERGLVRALPPEDLSPERLACDLLHLLTENTIPDRERIPPLDGAQRAAAAILDAMRGEGEATALIAGGGDP